MGSTGAFKAGAVAEIVCVDVESLTSRGTAWLHNVSPTRTKTDTNTLLLSASKSSEAATANQCNSELRLL